HHRFAVGFARERGQAGALVEVSSNARWKCEVHSDLKVKGRYMRSQLLSTVLCVLVSAGWAWAEQPSSCASLMNFKLPNVEITKAAPISGGSTESIPWSQSRS